MPIDTKNCTALTGGASRALDSHGISSLTDGDRAICMIAGDELLFFEFDSAATDAEDVATHPYKVRPDDYVSAGVWIEQLSDALILTDDAPASFGSSAGSKLLWETADANANALILALPDGGATNVPVFVIGDQGIIDSDLGWFNGQTIPRLAMVAADEGGHFSIGVDNSDILDILATTGPAAEVDETKFSHKLQVTINGSTYYIMLCDS